MPPLKTNNIDAAASGFSAPQVATPDVQQNLQTANVPTAPTTPQITQEQIANARAILEERFGKGFSINIPDKLTTDNLRQDITPAKVANTRAQIESQLVAQAQAQGAVEPELITAASEKLAGIQEDIVNTENRFKKRRSEIEAQGGVTRGFTQDQLAQLSTEEQEALLTLERREAIALNRINNLKDQDAAAFDRALRIENFIAGREDIEQQRLRDTFSSIIEFSAGLTYDELDPQSQESIANFAQQQGIPLGIIQNSMVNAKTAIEQAMQPDTQVVKLDNGQTVLINSQTGETIRNLGGVDVGANGNFLGSGFNGQITSKDLEGVDNETIKSIATAKAQQLGSVGEREAATEAISTFETGQDIIDQLQTVSTGPVVGRLRQGINLPFGLSIVGGRSLGTTSAEEDRLNSLMTVFTARFIKAISGTQVSDKEREFLMGALPDENKQEQANIEGIKAIGEFLADRYTPTLGIDLEPLVPTEVSNLEQDIFNSVVGQ